MINPWRLATLGLTFLALFAVLGVRLWFLQVAAVEENIAKAPADRYPDAKVILTKRNPERWYESMSETILTGMAEMGLTTKGSRDNPMYFGAVLIAQDAFNFDYSKENVMAALERHNSAVRAAIPASRLLEFEVSDGWEPLCAFLGVPVPDEPFPRTNERENFGEHIETAKCVARDLGGD